MEAFQIYTIGHTHGLRSNYASSFLFVQTDILAFVIMLCLFINI